MKNDIKQGYSTNCEPQRDRTQAFTMTLVKATCAGNECKGCQIHGPPCHRMHPRSAYWTGNDTLHADLACPACMQINIRQLCFFRVANASGHPELWWDYVQAFAANCSMAATRYNVDCAAEVCCATRRAVHGSQERYCVGD